LMRWTLVVFFYATVLGAAEEEEDSEEDSEARRARVVFESVLARPAEAVFRNRSRGVVYAAIGPSTLRKASASALSVRALYGREELGLLAVTSDAGLAFLGGDWSPFDAAVSIEGPPLDSSGLRRGKKRPSWFGGSSSGGPEEEEFEAFTAVGAAGDERRRRRRKPAGWASVRRLRTAKIAALAVALRSFDRAVFLDADTRLCSRLLDVAFEALGDHDVAFVPAPSSHHDGILERLYGAAVLDVPEPNSGVFAFRASAAPVLRRWLAVYWRESRELEPTQNPMDQPPLRAAVALERAKFATLPPALNCRGHVKHLNLALPLKCGGFTHDDVLDAVVDATLSSSTTTTTTTTNTDPPPPQRGERNQKRLKAALRDALEATAGCAVVHSHALPKPRRPCPSCPTTRKNVLLLPKREKDFPRPDDIVAVVALEPADSSACARPLRTRRLVAGDDRETRLADLPPGRRAAVVLVVHDPRRHAYGEDGALLERLIPLGDEPPRDRSRRLGPPNLADLADVLDRLEDDVALLLLASEPDASRRLVEAALPDRPDVHRAVADILACHGRYSTKEHNNATDHATTKGGLDGELYEACERLFRAQQSELKGGAAVRWASQKRLRVSSRIDR